MVENEFSCEYNHDWSRVTGSFWRQYWHPKCSYSRAFVLSRKIDEQGRLLTKRLHIIYQEVPAFLRAIVGNVVTYGGEETITDPKEQTLTVCSHNLSFCGQMNIIERCKYAVSSSNPCHTIVNRTLSVNGLISGFLKKKLETWYSFTDLDIYKKGIKVMNDILENVSSIVLPVSDLNVM